MLSPQKAAEKSGWSRATIMNALKNRELKAIRNNRGHWQIREEDLSEWVSERGDSVTGIVSQAADTRVQVLEAELRGKDALIEQLRADLAHARLPFWKRLLDR
tara:strand:+ start:788 stop:1096 length:309 start_codon:yes stop_codon:yes gene_type:complete